MIDVSVVLKIYQSTGYERKNTLTLIFQRKICVPVCFSFRAPFYGKARCASLEAPGICWSSVVSRQLGLQQFYVLFVSLLFSSTEVK